LFIFKTLKHAFSMTSSLNTYVFLLKLTFKLINRCHVHIH